MSSIKLITWKMFFMLRMKKFFFIIGVYFFVILSAYSQTELLFGLGGGKFRFDKIKRILLIRHKCAHIIRSLF